jgi:hypothetical protein
MNNRSQYLQKLRDPKWQKKRLDVMSHHDFCCEICGDSESTLHVHHKQYLKNYEPWEYDVKQLSCVCENCHKNTHDLSDELSFCCSFLPLDGPNNRSEIAAIIAGILGVAPARELNSYEKILYEIGNFIYNPDKKNVLKNLKGNKNGKN